MNHIVILNPTFRRDRLTQAREAAGLTQLELARELDYFAALPVTGWESGYSQPSVDNLARLCTTLDVSADWLLGLEEQA